MVFGETDRQAAIQMARDIYEGAINDLDRGDVELVNQAIGALMALTVILMNAEPSKKSEQPQLKNLRIAVKEMGMALKDAANKAAI